MFRFRQGSAKRAVAGAMLAGMLTVGQGLAFDRVDFTVTGTDTATVKELRAASGLVAAQKQKVTDPQDLLAKARAEYGGLLSALYARGYYSAVIHVRIDGQEAAEISPLDAPGSIGRIEVSIETGPKFTFSRAEIAPLAEGTVIPKTFATGQVAESGVILEAVGAGIDGWRAKGNAKAAVADQSVTADHARSALAAQIRLAPGPKLRFGQLAVQGAERMRPERVRAIAGLPEGKVYNPDDVKRAAERLRRSGVFRSATLTEAEQVRAPDLLDMTATVIEAPRRHYSFGAAVASGDGASLTGEWYHRNLFGGAERLTVDGSILNIGAASGIDYNFGIGYSRPATFTPDTALGLKFDLGRLDELDYKADTLGLTAELTHVFSDSLTGSAGLGYEYSRVTDPQGEKVFRRLTLPLGLIWDRRDSTTDATRGFYIDATAKPFLGFGITDSGARLTLDARGYKAVDQDRRFVMAARLQAGAIVGASLMGTPRDDLFYSGGGGTVRGQPYQSLGVNVLRDLSSNTFRTGGTYFLGGSIEARAKLTDSLGLVGFVDVGQIGVNGFFNSLSDWHAGAGLGVRYATPVGPIRLDLAVPVGGKTGAGLQVYLGLGQAF